MKRTSGLDPSAAMARAGMTNPKGDIPCGPLDVSAHIPEPAHYDCRECHRIIRNLLSARAPIIGPGADHQQIKLPIMEPDDE